MPFAEFNLPVSNDANELLSTDAFALLIGMILDQQFPIERAFASPLELKERLGGLSVEQIVDYDPEALTTIFCTPPALHRYPAANAKRVMDLAHIITDVYDGDPTNIWSTAKTGAELVKRIEKLPGFGKAKARIFTALLAKQMDVRPRGWKTACEPYGRKGSTMSVADIVDEDTLLRTRAWKQKRKAAAATAANQDLSGK